MFQNHLGRNTSVEIFRLLSMVGIVIYHCILWGNSDGLGGANYELVYALGSSYSTAVHLSLYSLGNAGVTCFMFISGYYGVKLDLKKMLNLIIMMLFYIVIIRLIAGVSIIKVIGSILHPWDGWWFVKCYFFICILSPLLNKGIEHVSKQAFTWIVVLLIIYTYIGHFLALKSEMNSDLLITIFLIGRYIKNYPPKVLMKYSAVLSVLSFLLISLIPVAIATITHSNSLMTLFLSNNNFLLLIFASSTVILLEKHPTHIGIINWLASSTLAIYLITDNELRCYLDPWLWDKVISNPIIGYLFIVLFCVACLLFEKVRELIFSPLIKIMDKHIKDVKFS